MVAIRATNGRLAGVLFAGIITGRSDENRSSPIHAQIVTYGVVDQILRVKRSAQVDMQVAAFGHLAKERQPKCRLPLDGIEIARSALLRACARLRHRHTGGPGDDQENKRPNDSRHNISSKMLLETALYLDIEKHENNCSDVAWPRFATSAESLAWIEIQKSTRRLVQSGLACDFHKCDQCLFTTHNYAEQEGPAKIAPRRTSLSRPTQALHQIRDTCL